MYKVFELPTQADTGNCSVERPCFLWDHISPPCTEYALGPSGYNFSQQSPTTRPSVERAADKAFLLSDRVELSSAEARVKEIKGGSVSRPSRLATLREFRSWSRLEADLTTGHFLQFSCDLKDLLGWVVFIPTCSEDGILPCRVRCQRPQRWRETRHGAPRVCGECIPPLGSLTWQESVLRGICARSGMCTRVRPIALRTTTPLGPHLTPSPDERGSPVQGNLDKWKTPTPLGSPQDPRRRLTVGSEGGAFHYK